MANLKMSLSTDGLLDPRRLEAWTREKQQQIHRGITRAMLREGPAIAKRADSQARQALHSKRRNFPNIRAKVYSQRADIPPALRIYSKVPWLGIHATGGVIKGARGKLLVPLIQMNAKAFRRVLQTISRTGAGFFKEIRGKVYLFAEYQPEYGRGLGRFRTSITRGLGGGRIKKGADVPIAVLVSQVTIRKRINMESIVRQGLPGLARAIEREI